LPLDTPLGGGITAHVTRSLFAAWFAKYCLTRHALHGLFVTPQVVVIDNADVLRTGAFRRSRGGDGGTFVHDARVDQWVASKDILRSSPLQWLLLNHSEPLIVLLHSDNFCRLRWPRTTHHLLYRDVWCDQYQHEWYASRAAEHGRDPSAAWLRSMPFGIGYDGGLEALEAEMRPASERPLLVSFRGTLTFRKPSREQLMLAGSDASLTAELQSVADRVVGRVPAHPSGVGRVLLETKRELTEGKRAACLAPVGLAPTARTPPCRRRPCGHAASHVRPTLSRVALAADASASTITYLELLRSSVFTLSPPGDLWEAYRTYEAIAAGSIPVVVANASYKGCTNPAAHLLATVPGLVVVRSWDELPAALASAAVHMSWRQTAMLTWFANEKRTLYRELVGAAAQMRSARSWRARTACSALPLAHLAVVQQHRALSTYWRTTAQPFVDDVWNGTLPFGPRYLPKRLDEEGVALEPCLTTTCSPPLVERLACGPRDGAILRAR
jgi:hypothetical protein